MPSSVSLQITPYATMTIAELSAGLAETECASLVRTIPTCVSRTREAAVAPVGRYAIGGVVLPRSAEASAPNLPSALSGTQIMLMALGSVLKEGGKFCIKIYEAVPRSYGSAKLGSDQSSFCRYLPNGHLAT